MQPWVQSFVSCAHTCETAANAARTERALKIIVEDVVVTGVGEGRQRWAEAPTRAVLLPSGRCTSPTTDGREEAV